MSAPDLIDLRRALAKIRASGARGCSLPSIGVAAISKSGRSKKPFIHLKRIGLGVATRLAAVGLVKAIDGDRYAATDAPTRSNRFVVR
jgi:hypothetical protein